MKIEKKMSSRFYLDTSAYLTILLGQPEAKTLLRNLNGKTICSSTLLLIEAERNLIRLARERVIKDKDYELLNARIQEDRHLFILRDFSADLCFTGIFPATKVPRSLDLAHIRTAKWFQAEEGLQKFLTTDSHQREAAREVGL